MPNLRKHNAAIIPHVKLVLLHIVLPSMELLILERKLFVYLLLLLAQLFKESTPPFLVLNQMLLYFLLKFRFDQTTQTVEFFFFNLLIFIDSEQFNRGLKVLIIFLRRALERRG